MTFIDQDLKSVHVTYFFDKLLIFFMYYNPGTWHYSSQVKLTNEESCPMNKLESKVQIKKSKSTWEQPC